MPWRAWRRSTGRESRRVRPLEVVAEYEKTVLDELDLMREAANAAQLKRNFAGSDLLYVPQVYWDYCRVDVHGHGAHPRRRDQRPGRLREIGTDFRKLAENGVRIFFTQVFRHNFFHADMHPGNIFVLVDDPAQSPLRGGRLRDRRHAGPARPVLPGRELPGGASIATTGASPPCTWNPGGCRRAPASTRWSPPCARFASRSSTSR